ncbi:unnamed protein product, partial [Meganyctiphanes norvegica]
MGNHIWFICTAAALLTAAVSQSSMVASASTPLPSFVAKEMLQKDGGTTVPHHVFQLLTEIMKQHLQDCHIMVFAQDSLSTMVGQMQESQIPAVAINSSELTDDARREYLEGFLKNREGTFPCRARVIDVTQNGLKALSFLDDLMLWRWPETYIFLYGELEGDLRSDLMRYFTHKSIRN